MASLQSLMTLLKQIESGDLTPCRETVHPRHDTHAQATLRWSTTNPPMAQVPGHLEHLFMPAPGYGFFRYDWSALHLWLTAAYANDTVLFTRLLTGADLHTLNACDLFQWPYPVNQQNPHTSPECAEWRAAHNWEGKDDPRRTFAKRFLYRVLKGGDVSQPPAGIPMTLFGGSSHAFVKASKAWALANVKVMQWQHRVKDQVLQHGQVTTAWGKVRKFSTRDAGAQRGGIDFLCQGTEAEILNETVLLTSRACSQDAVRMVYTRHDCIIWEVADTAWNDATLHTMATIAQRAITIYNMTFNLQADFHTRRGGSERKRLWTPANPV